MNRIRDFAAYINPFGKNPCSDRSAFEEFYDLDTKSKVYTVFLTALAFIGSIPLLGTGAVAIFRLCTHRWSVISADSSDESQKAKTAEKAETVFDAMVPKKIKKTDPPIGFINNGGSCWFATGLQFLLSTPFFEKIVRAPLKPETIDKYYKGAPVYRPLSLEELKCRANIQTALIELIDRRNERNPEAINKAMIQLHRTILENPIAGTQADFSTNINQWSDPIYVIKLLGKVFGFDDIFLHTQPIHFLMDPSSLKTPEEKAQMNSMAKLLKRRVEKMPDFIVFTSIPEFIGDCDVNQVIDLSKYTQNGEEALYRIVGRAHNIGECHWVADIRNQEQWYFCSDDKVMEESAAKISLQKSDNIILERIL